MVPAVKPEDMSPDPKVVSGIIDLYMKFHFFLKAQGHMVHNLSAPGPILAVNVPTVACVDVLH